MTSYVIYERAMRAARLLHCLLLLQNRGKLTTAQLASELEVSRRTVLRDIDALTEAGLPIIVHQGAYGGVELGFDYRSKLTALTGEEAEALGIILANPHPALDVLGLGAAARQACNKIIETQSDEVRQKISAIQSQIAIYGPEPDQDDPRPIALARAIRGQQTVVLKCRSTSPVRIKPCRLEFLDNRWMLFCKTDTLTPIPEMEWGDIAISALKF